MAHWQARFKGNDDRFISGVEFIDGKKSTLTIDHIEMHQLEQEDGSQKNKPIIFFKEIKRGWVYCKTTGHLMSAMFGDDDAKWSGKRVTLHGEMVSVSGEMKPGIRITGSPDIDRTLSVKIKLPKKKAFVVKLVPTGKLATTKLDEKKENDDVRQQSNFDRQPRGQAGAEASPVGAGGVRDAAGDQRKMD